MLLLRKVWKDEDDNVCWAWLIRPAGRKYQSIGILIYLKN